MIGKPVTKRQLVGSLCVAVITDLVQIPAALSMVAAAATVVGAGANVPVEVIDLGLDIFAAVVMTVLLGFDLALLPTFVIEAVPIIDAAPTWTVCVVYVIAKRRRQGRLLK